MENTNETPDDTGTNDNNSQPKAENKRFQQAHAKVDEIVGIMRENVDHVLNRDQKLSDLGERAETLQQGAAQFGQQAKKLKHKQWWTNMRLMITLCVICVTIVILIIIPLVLSERNSNSNNVMNSNSSSKNWTQPQTVTQPTAVTEENKN